MTSSGDGSSEGVRSKRRLGAVKPSRTATDRAKLRRQVFSMDALPPSLRAAIAAAQPTPEAAAFFDEALPADDSEP